MKRIRPTMTDYRDAQDFRFLLEHGDLFEHCALGQWDVYPTPAALEPISGKGPGDSPFPDLRSAILAARKMLEGTPTSAAAPALLDVSPPESSSTEPGRDGGGGV